MTEPTGSPRGAGDAQVVKVGGTSVADAAACRRVVEMVRGAAARAHEAAQAGARPAGIA